MRLQLKQSIINSTVKYNPQSVIFDSNLGWQKAVLVFIGLSLLSALLSCTMGLCAPCTPGCAVLHSIFAFFACKINSTLKYIHFFQFFLPSPLPQYSSLPPIEWIAVL
jgi:hypothetical protein